MPTFFEKSPHNNVSQPDSPASVFELADWFDTLKKEHAVESGSTPLQQIRTLVNVGFLFPIVSQYLTYECSKVLEKSKHAEQRSHDTKATVMITELTPTIDRYKTLYYQLKTQEKEYKAKTQVILKTWFKTDLSDHSITINHFEHAPIKTTDPLCACLNLFLYYLRSKQEKYKQTAQLILNEWLEPDSSKRDMTTHNPESVATREDPLYLSIELFFQCFQSKQLTDISINTSNREYSALIGIGKNITNKQNKFKTLFTELFNKVTQRSEQAIQNQTKSCFFREKSAGINADIQTVAQFIKNLLEENLDFIHPSLLEQANNATLFNDIFSAWASEKCWLQPTLHPYYPEKEPLPLLARQSTIRFKEPAKPFETPVNHPF